MALVTIVEAFALAFKHQQQGNLHLAEQLCKEILHVDASHADSYHLLGVLSYQREDFQQAESFFRHALALAQTASCHSNLGLTYEALGLLEEAVASYRQALHLRPEFAVAHNNLANARRKQGNLDEAIHHYQQALALQPEYAEAHNNLGLTFDRIGMVEKAIHHFRQALEIKPDFAEAHNNLGSALENPEEALEHYQQALLIRPDFPEAHYDLALLWLLLGDFERGWTEYEWRWKLAGRGLRAFCQPLWDGSPLNGRTVLLHAEQGLGDTLQFIRYAPLVKQHGGKVIVECQSSLLRLMAGIEGVDSLWACGAPLPAFDVQAPLTSLPRIFRSTLNTIPGMIPFLQADADLVKQWRQQLQWTVDSGRWTVKTDESTAAHRSLSTIHRPPFKVGVAWQGNPDFRSDIYRSIPLRCFANLAQVDGVHLISLQKGPGIEQLDAWPGLNAPLNLGNRFDEEAGPFMDTAAIMHDLDLVICSDSAVAHLAGALGVPVWVALPRVPDWRWLLEREDSPWYPTMRLFRQRQNGNWSEVFGRIEAEFVKTMEGTRMKHG
jgi:tetratricopeptide (TPR) repeat protein